MRTELVYQYHGIIANGDSIIYSTSRSMFCYACMDYKD